MQHQDVTFNQIYFKNFIINCENKKALGTGIDYLGTFGKSGL